VNLDWIAEGQLAAMARPWPEDVGEMRRLGITAVLSLTDRVPRELASSGFEVLHLPIRDFEPPTQEELVAAIEFIERTVGRGGACAVQCGAGLGRTGTVAAAWLVRRGRSAREAILEVRRRRPGSVETRDQESAVEQFERACRGPRGG
jgi:atypical dual specificity phosphatase